MKFDEQGYICPYNENCRCQIADCDFCGWNPMVTEQRLEKICENLGIEKKKAACREINAIDLVCKIGKYVLPLVDRGCSQRRIYAETMKCIAASPTLNTDKVTCEKCRFARYFEESGKWKCRSMNGLYREVAPDEYCSWGEREVADGAE